MAGISRNSAGMEVYSLDLPTGQGIGRNAAGAEIYQVDLPTGLGGMITRDSAGREVYLAGITPGGPQSFLGSSLIGYWDAERSDKLSLSGGSVNSWTDLVGGYAPSQSFGASKPAYSATSFNGRPGITFDGIDDELTLASIPFPTGTAACEIWALTDRTSAPTDTSVRCIFGYGNTSNDSRRALHQGATTSSITFVSVGTGSDGSISGTNGGNFTGRHVSRHIISGTDARTAVDGNFGDITAVVPATSGTGRTRIGANTSSTPGQFHQGVISAILIIDPTKPEWTSAAQARLLAYLKARGGIA